MVQQKPFDTLVSFTYKGRERLKADGGSGNWVLKPEKARKCSYLIVTRNANGAPPNQDHPHLPAEGDEPHRSAFLAGKVTGVRLAKDQPNGADRKPRYVVEVGKWADLPSLPEIWKKGLNPIRYTRLEELGINVDDLSWEEARS